MKRIMEVPIKQSIFPTVVEENEPSMDDFLKVLLMATRELKIQAYHLLKGDDSLVSSPVVVQRVQFEKLYTSRQVRQITGLHRNTIGKATRSGKLRATRRGPHTPYLYPESAVQAWIDGSKQTNKSVESVKNIKAEKEEYEKY